MTLHAIFLALLIGCSGQPKGTDTPSPDSLNATAKQPLAVAQNESLLDHRDLLDFDSSYFDKKDSLKEYLIKIFRQDLEGIRSTDDITSISPDQNATLQDLGRVKIYKATFSNDLPEVAPKIVYLVYSVEKRQAALLFLDNSLQLIKLRKSSEDYLIAGTYRVRGKGYFAVYQYNKKNQFDLIFDSSTMGDCDNGIAVMNASLDCVSYDPFDFDFQNVDSDKDGLNDLVFKGTINRYCEGLETNTGRNDRKPLKSEKVTIIFKTSEAKDNLHWNLVDTSVCKKLVHSF